MSQESVERSRWANAHHDFFAHVVTMPGWHKSVLLIGALLAVLGTAGVLAGKMGGTAPPPVTSGGAAAPSGASKMVDDGTSAGGSAQRTETKQPAGLLGSLSPHAMKVGASIVAGFVIGWLFRAFLKTMALVALVAGGIVWGLSHFGIIDLGSWDASGVKQHSAEAMSWLDAHLSQWKAAAISRLPSTGGGALGAFLGFRRR